MKKIEKWLVCINDMVEEPTTYLLHTRSPRFLIEIKDLDLNTTPDPGKLSKSLVYINPESLPEMYELEIIHQYENAENKVFLKQLDLAAKWYKQYLKWEDGGTTGFLKDYNENTPGLKIIYSEYASKWLTIYKGAVFIHHSEPDLDNYLYQLGFNDSDLKQGFIFNI